MKKKFDDWKELHHEGKHIGYHFINDDGSFEFRSLNDDEIKQWLNKQKPKRKIINK